MIPKSLTAFALAVAMLIGLALRHRALPSPPLRLTIFAVCCFLIVSTIHVFEAFGLWAAAGWGQPHSVGHYIDLGAALIGIVLLGAAVVVFASRARR